MYTFSTTDETTQSNGEMNGLYDSQNPTDVIGGLKGQRREGDLSVNKNFCNSDGFNFGESNGNLNLGFQGDTSLCSAGYPREVEVE